MQLWFVFVRVILNPPVESVESKFSASGVVIVEFSVAIVNVLVVVVSYASVARSMMMSGAMSVIVRSVFFLVSNAMCLFM